jgi:hypothetical protein
MLGDKEIITGRYYNSNGYACAIVAVVNEGIDWGAYIGGADYMLSEEEAIEWIAKMGDKLSKEDAMYFFPDIKLPYRL